MHLPKAVKGEPFPDLDMLTKLLAPPGTTHAKRPLIEVLGENESLNNNNASILLILKNYGYIRFLLFSIGGLTISGDLFGLN